MKSNPKTLTCNWRKRDREEERGWEGEDETYKAAKSFEQSPRGDWRSAIAAASFSSASLRPYPRDDHPERDLRVGRKGGGRRVTLHFQLGGNQPLLEGGGPLIRCLHWMRE